MTKFHAHVAHMAKHMNMVGGLLWWGALVPGPFPPLNSALPPLKYIFCADFGSTIDLDLQQKLKPFLHSSQEQIAMASFLGIYSSFVYFESSIR